ncbi:hypothetical protein [Streptomyces radicis]|nr:hypothetical protein [Streptomyces radicis]
MTAGTFTQRAYVRAQRVQIDIGAKTPAFGRAVIVHYPPVSQEVR